MVYSLTAFAWVKIIISPMSPIAKSKVPRTINKTPSKSMGRSPSAMLWNIRWKASMTVINAPPKKIINPENPKNLSGFFVNFARKRY